MTEITQQTDSELVKLINHAKDELRKRSDKRLKDAREQEEQLLKSAGINGQKPGRKGAK